MYIENEEVVDIVETEILTVIPKPKASVTGNE